MCKLNNDRKIIDKILFKNESLLKHYNIEITNRIYDDLLKADRYINITTETGKTIKLEIIKFCNGTHHVKAITNTIEVVYEICPDKVREYKEKQKEQFSEFRFDNFITDTKPKRDALNIAKKFLTSSYRHLIFSGKNGTGKSHLAKAIYNQSIDMGLRQVYINAIELRRILRDNATMYGAVRKEAETNIKKLLTTDLLVIDDLGQEVEDEYFREGLYMLFEKYKGKIVITVNFGIRQIKERYKDAIVSRMFDKAVTKEFLWEDYRTRLT